MNRQQCRQLEVEAAPLQCRVSHQMRVLLAPPPRLVQNDSPAERTHHQDLRCGPDAVHLVKVGSHIIAVCSDDELPLADDSTQRISGCVLADEQ